MPELPEVESIRLGLEPVVKGCRIERISVNVPRMLIKGDPADLTGKYFTTIDRRGKYLQIMTDSDLSLHVHLRMSGTLLWREPDEELPDFARIIVYLDKGKLVFRDVRTLGNIWIAGRNFTPWRKLGVEPFSEDLTAEYLKNKLIKRSIPIKVALLDQSVIAGIGNIYASEILFDCGINPRKAASGLSKPKLNLIIASTRKILSDAIHHNGTTLKDFRLSNGRDGNFTDFLRVYRKLDVPCCNCNTPIKRIVQSQRSTYFCPVCQK